MRTRRLSAGLAAAALTAAGLTAALGGSTPAQAIPTLAQACAQTSDTQSGGSGWQLMHAPLWVHNQSFARTVINVNADVEVDRGARVVIAYRVDQNGFLQNPGARNFASWSEFSQTRHSMVVMPVGTGWHRVYVYWRVIGSSSDSATVGGHCITVEGDTN